MIKCFSLISLVNSLILSIKSSLSLCITSCISFNSFFAIWYLLSIFSISLFLFSNSSYWLENFSTNDISSSSLAFSSYSNLNWFLLFSSNSAFVFNRSYSYFIAFSIASEPLNSFSSIFLIFFNNFYYLLFSFC